MPRGIYPRTEEHLKILDRARNIAIKNRRGKPSWSKGLTKKDHPSLANCHREKGFKHSKETIALMKEAKIGYVPKKNKFKKGHKFPQEIYDKVSKTLKANPYKHTKEDIIKIKLSRAKQIFPIKDTSIEIKIQNLLTQLEIKYFKHKYITEIKHKYQCDILIPSINLIIECDGNYWHKYPTGTEIDHIRTKELIEKGFKVLRLWGSEIKTISKEQLNKLIACGDTVRPCFEFIQDKASVVEAGNYREISRRSP